MKILSLSLDQQVLKGSSQVAARQAWLSDWLEKYSIVVPATETSILAISSNITAYGSGGQNKVSQWIKTYQLAKNLLKADQYNIITVQDPYYLGLLGLFLARKFNLKLEIQIHGFEKETWLRKKIASFVIGRADGIRVVSQRLKRDLMTDFSASEEKIVVIPIYSPANHKIKPDKDYASHQPFKFLTVGRLVSVKNIKLQLMAFKELISKYPDIQLTIVGDGPERRLLQEMVKDLNLVDKVVMVGQVDCVDSFYQATDAFLLTSNREGWGLVVIEAGSFGLPVIMTEVGCAGEVVIDKESGLVVPVGSKTALIQAMTQIIEDQALRAHLGSNLAQKVTLLPSKDQTLSLYSQAWKRLL